MRDVLEKTCAACGATVSYAGPSFFASKGPRLIDHGFGLDGRPCYAEDDLRGDAAALAHQLELVECAACGHVAPWIDLAFPRIKESKEAREELSALPEHDDLARRYLYVAQLYGDEDPREEGIWALRAAWADEAAGFIEHGRAIRRRAGRLLEEALYFGAALEPFRGGSCLMLSEIFRVGSELERAAEHCRRGLAVTPKGKVRCALLLEGRTILYGRTERLTRMHLRDALEDLQASETEISEALRARFPEVPPVRLRRARRFRHRDMHRNSAAYDVFEEDFLHEDLMIDMLRIRAVWPGLVAHPELLPALLRATDHEDEEVRRHAVESLYDKVLAKSDRTVHASGFDPEVLRGHGDAVDALVRRLTNDDDDALVCKAGAVLRQVVFLDPSFGPTIAAGAYAALPKWSRDLSTTGVLERIIDSVPK